MESPTTIKRMGALVVAQLPAMMGEVTTVTGMLAEAGILVVVVQGTLTSVVVVDPTMVVVIKTTSRVRIPVMDM